MIRVRASAVVLGVMTAVSCDDVAGPNISGVPGYLISSVRVSPTRATAVVGDIIQSSDQVTFTAAAFGKSGAQLTLSRFVWSTSDPAIAVVDSAGVVTPLARGTVEISASADKIGSAVLEILPATDTILISPKIDTIFVGDQAIPPRDTTRLVAAAYDAQGVRLTDALFDWTSSSDAIAEVDASGLVRAIAPGTATIQATSEGRTGAATVMVVEAAAMRRIRPGP